MLIGTIRKYVPKYWDREWKPWRLVCQAGLPWFLFSYSLLYLDSIWVVLMIYVWYAFDDNDSPEFLKARGWFVLDLSEDNKYDAYGYTLDVQARKLEY